MNLHDPHYWQSVYEAEARPGWDMDGPTPLLPELMDIAESLGLKVGPRIAVPGCGFGHDAAELARWGFQVTGVDFAPSAIDGARARYGDLVDWRLMDWFEAPTEANKPGAGSARFGRGGAGVSAHRADPRQGLKPFDAVFDHTCFVAMAPERRPAFIDICAERLVPGGLWLGAFFHRVNNPPGPPFALEPEELRRLAEARFEVLHLGEAERSHPRRAGREFLLVGLRR